jgi:hypothetical protein
MGHISSWLRGCESTEMTDIINENTVTLTDASKEVGLDINIEKTICCCILPVMQIKMKTYK